MVLAWSVNFSWEKILEALELFQRKDRFSKKEPRRKNVNEQIYYRWETSSLTFFDQCPQRGLKKKTKNTTLQHPCVFSKGIELSEEQLKATNISLITKLVTTSTTGIFVKRLTKKLLADHRPFLLLFVVFYSKNLEFEALMRKVRDFQWNDLGFGAQTDLVGG